MESEDSFEKFHHTYALLIHTVPFPIEQVNQQLNDAIQNALQPLTDVHKHAETTIDLTLGASERLQALPPKVFVHLDDLMARIDLDKFLSLNTALRQLMRAFHEAVQEPTSIFPRLVCGEVPVDPVRVISFRKRYARLEHLHELDPDLNFEDRSMPVVPKSGMDVITNITTSLESFTDAVHAAVEGVQQVVDAVKRVKSGVGGTDVAGVLKQLEEVKEVVSKFWEMLRGDGVSPTEAMVAVKETIGKLEGMSEELAKGMEAMRESGDELLQLAVRMEDVVGGVEREVGRLVRKVGRLDVNIPRIERELRSFFWPTGLQGLIMRPAFLLETLLKGLDDVKRELGNVDEIEYMDVGVEEVKNCIKQVEVVRESVGKMVVCFVEGDLIARVAEALEVEFAKLCSEVDEVVEESAAEAIEAVGEKIVTGATGAVEQVLQGDSTTSQIIAWGIDKLFT